MKIQFSWPLRLLPDTFNNHYASASAAVGYEEIINGLKSTLEGDTRWLLMRASETEPLVRIYAEGENQYEPEELLQEGKLLINR